MKKSIYLIALSIASLLLLSSCESGNTSANSEPDLGGTRVQTAYTGTYTFSGNVKTGTVRLDLQESAGGSVVGNVSYSNGRCLCDSDLSGTRNGTNLNLTSEDCTLEYRPTVCDESDKEDNGQCKLETESGRVRFLLSGTQSRLSGSFTVSGGVCTIAANLPASGTVELGR